MTPGRAAKLAFKVLVGVPLGYWVVVRTMVTNLTFLKLKLKLFILLLFQCYTEMKLGKMPVDYVGRCWICPPNAEIDNANPENWLNRLDK